MDDLKKRILMARKPVRPPRGGEATTTGDVEASIAPVSNSSFGSLKKKGMTSHKAQPAAYHAHRWADSMLREHAPRDVRVTLAVRDAARRAEAKGLDPTVDGIYVTSSIREGWNLQSDQLSKGLSFLKRQHFIKFVEQRKGRHARFLLVSPC